jgi:hypothetical protein
LFLFALFRLFDEVAPRQKIVKKEGRALGGGLALAPRARKAARYVLATQKSFLKIT